MEKMVLIVVLALAITLATVPASFSQQDMSGFQGFSLDDIQGLTGSLDQNNKEPAGADVVKQAAAADFQNGQGQVDGLSLDDVKAAADNSFQGASDPSQASWLEWAKDKLQGFGMVDSTTDSVAATAGPGGAPSAAPGASADADYNF